jgi:hypothetical protein
VVPIVGQQERVEIQWIIKDAKGNERGRVVQLNVIPAGSLDHYWGDVASVVATEASGGVNDVLKKQTAPPPPPPAGAAAVRGQQAGALLEQSGNSQAAR